MSEFQLSERNDCRSHFEFCRTSLLANSLAFPIAVCGLLLPRTLHICCPVRAATVVDAGCNPPIPRAGPTTLWIAGVAAFPQTASIGGGGGLVLMLEPGYLLTGAGIVLSLLLLLLLALLLLFLLRFGCDWCWRALLCFPVLCLDRATCNQHH